MRTWYRFIPPVVAVGVLIVIVGMVGLQGRIAHEEGELDESLLPPLLTEQPPGAGASPKIVLRAPTAPLPLRPISPPVSFEQANHALGFRYRSEIFEATAEKPKVVGYARRGTYLKTGKRIYGPGCSGGRWYPVPGGGHVCTKRGFLVDKSKPKRWIRQRAATLTGVLPYRYARLKEPEAPRLFRVPTTREVKLMAQAAAGKSPWPDVVDKRMKGIFFVALDRIEGGSHYRTIRGRYVHKDHLRHLTAPAMRGQLLDRDNQLPLVFVYGEDSPIYRLEQKRLAKVGKAEKHARFPLRRIFDHEGRKLVEGPDSIVLPRDNVRIVRRIARPDRIPDNVKWIHVDLSEQSLVAYKDERPVFATLVSSGKEGFEPPIGVFRVVSKRLSITMNGPDPDDGWYEVEEVPWTQYYWESYALHGTYWHNDFGKPRSHGCTNLAPTDARWLFTWTDPRLPEGWHGALGSGTHVTFSG